MATAGPEDTVDAFFAAFNRNDVESVIACYEPTAAFVAQPGQIAEGHAAIRDAVNAFLILNPTLTPEKKSLVKANGLALSIVKWTLTGTAPDRSPVRMEGTTSDVLRQQADGRWLYAIDNPWGAGILG